MEQQLLTQNTLSPVAQEWIRPSALDRYRTNFYGNKRALLSNIANLLPPETKTVADLFSGTGIVSWFLKHQGYKIIANDIMRYPFLRLRALIGNNGTTLTADDVQMLREPNADTQGFIQQYYARSLGQENCNFLETWANNIPRLTDPIKKDIAVYVCVTCISAHCKYATAHFNPLGVITGHQRHWEINLEREVCDYALQVFPEFICDNRQQNECHNMDALDLVSKVEADVLYLDPPYACRAGSYEGHYAFFDDLVSALCNKGATISDPYDSKSDLGLYTNFGSRTSAMTGLARLFDRCRHIPCVIFSYNTTSRISSDEIMRAARVYRKDINAQFIPRPRATTIKGNNTHTEEVLMVCR